MASSRKLESASEKLRARQIGWDGYCRAGDITQEELNLISRIAKQPKSTSDTHLQNDFDIYAKLLLKLLSKSNRTDAVQWSLVMLGDLIIGKDETVAKNILAYQPWDALVKHLDSQDEFCQLKSATIISLLLPSEPSAPSKVANKLTRALGAFLRQNWENQDIALQCLNEVLRSHEIRLLVWNSETSEKGKSQAENGKIIEGLVELLKSMVEAQSPSSPQTQYGVAMCFWLFSFEKVIDEKIERFGTIPLLSDVARRAVKEKVVRVILSAFRNMLTLAPTENQSAMLMSSSGMLNFTQSLITTKKFFGDDEVKEDAEWLRDYLRAARKELTTWDEYVAELDSKHLSWTPCHTDDEFWNENARKLCDNNHAVLKKLVALLEPGQSATTYSIVCSDLAMFIKYYDLGKRDIQKLGGKTRVLELLNSNPDPEVRYKALVVVQMLVSQSWQA